MIIVKLSKIDKQQKNKVVQCYELVYGYGVNLEEAKSYHKKLALKGNFAYNLKYKLNQKNKNLNQGDDTCMINFGKQENYLFAHQYLIQIMIQNSYFTQIYFYLRYLQECGFRVQEDQSKVIHYYFKGSKLKSSFCMTELGILFWCY
ncbi:unnamed protein product [Paramecium sonneborni]|uniref:Uncharacterized protein n=1 Tax=Paramecium sonneborni TaxID=65129 RepID=A0A8S1PPY4_9CILI|nr:unnamed protein product [Paramecium sonneborni]